MPKRQAALCQRQRWHSVSCIEAIYDKTIIILFWVLLENSKTWPKHPTAIGFGLNCLLANITTAPSYNLSLSTETTSLTSTPSFSSTTRPAPLELIVAFDPAITSLLPLTGVSAFRSSQMIGRVFDRLRWSSCANLSLSSKADLSQEYL